ncbi:MAG: cupredoxin domain-containing protein [Solirubrobacterales bacterium]
MRPRLCLVATAVAAGAAMAAFAAGCGGSSDSSSSTAASSSSTAAQAGGAASNVDISETDFKLNASDPKVKSGQVTFNVSNDGQTVHSLEVEGPNGDQELQSDLSPGQKGVLSMDLSKPGKYEFYCPVANHKQLGMKGEITVQ